MNTNDPTRVYLVIQGAWQLFLERWFLVLLWVVVGYSAPALLGIMLLIYIARHLHLIDLANTIQWPLKHGIFFF